MGDTLAQRRGEEQNHGDVSGGANGLMDAVAAQAGVDALK
jgi:hypothetical protein